MSLAEVENAAMKLSDSERALLAASLWQSVSTDPMEHREDEFELREREIESGHVQEIGYDELIRRVKAERGR